MHVTTRKWPKAITKVRHDHTYASSNLAPADNKDSGHGNSYLTIILEGSDLVSPFKVKSIGENTSNYYNA